MLVGQVLFVAGLLLLLGMYTWYRTRQIDTAIDEWAAANQLSVETSERARSFRPTHRAVVWSTEGGRVQRGVVLVKMPTGARGAVTREPDVRWIEPLKPTPVPPQQR
jgi:hypothetical protein